MVHEVHKVYQGLKVLRVLQGLVDHWVTLGHQVSQDSLELLDYRVKMERPDQ